MIDAKPQAAVAPHARPRRTPAHGVPGRAKRTRLGTGRRPGRLGRARRPRRAVDASLPGCFFLFLFVLCYFGAPRASRSSGLSRRWHPPFSPVAWCVRSSRGAFASFYATSAPSPRSRPPDRRGRSSRRLSEGLYIYVMHRLYTQGLVVGMLWSGAPDVVARATHRRSALELGARPTGNWRRGAAGLNSPCGESPAAASGAVGRDRRGDRRGRRRVTGPWKQ